MTYEELATSARNIKINRALKEVFVQILMRRPCIEIPFSTEVGPFSVEHRIGNKPSLPLRPVADLHHAFDLVLGDLPVGAARFNDQDSAVVAQHIDVFPRQC